jgi:hypothetical protein
LTALACESDETKLKRLQFDQSLACLPVEHPEMTLNDAGYISAKRGNSGPPKQDLVDSLRYEARIKCDLKTRDLNKFMNGR